MYLINHYQLVEVSSQLYLCNDSKGAKISSAKLADVLKHLLQQPHLEISAEELNQLALSHSVDAEQLKTVLITQLEVLKPSLSRKFTQLIINSDDDQVAHLLQLSFAKEYNVKCVPTDYYHYEAGTLLIFYRKNYSNPDFKKLYHHLSPDVHVITAGVVHKLLIIDNLYFQGSGLPTHVSNLHQLMAYLHSDIPATKNNWLLYYRTMVKNRADEFPDSEINACQQGYVAYSLYQFASQFTNLWRKPTTIDQVNWFWHVDLTTFNLHREVAVHSPFSEYDMKINLQNIKAEEPA